MGFLITISVAFPNELRHYQPMTVDQDKHLTGAVIGAAISVHRELGPGVDEPAYESALSRMLGKLGIEHECQKPIPVIYKKARLECGFRLDILVERRLPLELKAVEMILPIHDAQLLTYLRLGRFRLGLLLNFEVAALKDGIRRRVMTRAPKVQAAAEVGASDGFDAVSGEILRATLEVYRALGPGLLRSAYEECLCHELALRRIPFSRQHRLALRFMGCDLEHSAEVPLLVSGSIPVVCLSVASLTPLHEARLLARLRQGNWPYGFLLNFNTPTLKQGIRRLAL
jgi:GxxExxY protein